MKPELVSHLIATAELFGKEVTDKSAAILAADLSGFEEKDILHALRRCRMELTKFPTIAEIISRINDGRPGVEEAWAMLPKSESDSVCWTDEIAGAYAVCFRLIDEDMIAARMAFKETYSKLLSEARSNRTKIKWSLSLGHDVAGREAVALEAVNQNRLTADQVKYLIQIKPTEAGLKLLPGEFKNDA